MTVQSVKLAGKRFVIVPEKDLKNLQRQAKGTGSRQAARPVARQSARDLADIELAKKRQADPLEKPLPYEQVRLELGLL